LTADALDVRDYTDENDVESGRNTVIGSKVTVLPGAVLTLDVTDLIPVQDIYVPNKFTPAEAWAAAGQGHLIIGTGGTLKHPDPVPSTTYKVQAVCDVLPGRIRALRSIVPKVRDQDR
jgi:hypothetical protein